MGSVHMMEKIERGLVNPAGGIGLQETKWGMKSLRLKLESAFLQKGIALLVIGFLLGRALILSQLTPFALPFFAAVYLLKRDKAPLALIGLIAGALTLSISNTAYVFALSAMLLLVFRPLEKYHRHPAKALPLYVGALSFLAKCSAAYVLNQNLTVYDGIMGGVEAGLSLVLTLIFMQSIPLLSIQKRKKALKSEEVVSVIIMLASVMTGTIGWSLYNLSVEHILSRYLVMLFAFTAGATVGSTVGVVTGLIFSLANLSSFYQMSLLAFGGLLGGLMKEGRRLGTAAGLLVATLLIGMYGENQIPLQKTLMETGAAIVLLLLTPQGLISKLARHIPGTAEYAYDQQQYLRKIRDITVNRVEQFSSVFQALSKSFSQQEERPEPVDEERELDYFLSNVTEKTCQNCFKKDQCWSVHFHKTYDLMKNVMEEMDESTGKVTPSLYRELDKHCNRAKKVQHAIYQELALYQANQKLKKQVQESRKLVAEQLKGVSEVMGDFAREIQRERENHHKHELMLAEALEDFGIDIEQLEIYSVEPGNIDIDMAVPNCGGLGRSEKLIAPLLSDLLNEEIIVRNEECGEYPHSLCYVNFGSAKAFIIETGVAHAAKGGGFVSGDSYSTIELGAGKFAVAISDGMGNGERAHHESNETLQLLRKILQTGIEEKVAIKSVNSVLSLRTTDEIFSTLDLAMIDLQDASAKFLKIGSSPSFIKRGGQVIKIEAGNLPMGMIQEFDVDVVTEQLRAGDLLIMMSDGVFEGPRHVENHDIWMKRKIKEMETEDPQALADIIMEEVIRTRSGAIEDDMTIVAAKIKHNTPKWAAIPVKKNRTRIS